jgi:aspartate carbamoyltransferase catalytic subunit
VKNLLSAGQLSRDDAIALLDSAIDMSDRRASGTAQRNQLAGVTVANVFFEDSTRTRLSFEVAAKALGADVLTFTTQGSSVSKGESLKDSLQTLEALGANIIVLRHSDSGIGETVVRNGWVSTPVINAGDGTHEHPTQALLDAFTMRARLLGENARGSDLSGHSVLIVGDVLHSRVARSNMLLLTTLGAAVTVCAPRTLLPRSIDTLGVAVSHSLDEALEAQPNVVMTLRVQRERMSSAYFPTESEFSSMWGMNSARLAVLDPGAIVMHPGPMNRGLEITSAVADSAQSTVLEQVINGVAVRMAVLNALAGGPQ